MIVVLATLFSFVVLGLLTRRLDGRLYVAIGCLALGLTSLLLYAPWLM